MEISIYDTLTPLRIGSFDVRWKSEGKVPCKTKIRNTDLRLCCSTHQKFIDFSETQALVEAKLNVSCSIINSHENLCRYSCFACMLIEVLENVPVSRAKHCDL